MLDIVSSGVIGLGLAVGIVLVSSFIRLDTTHKYLTCTRNANVKVCRHFKLNSFR